MKILKIPFISRPKAKSKSIWFAKFLFDEETWKILEQWCELLEWSQFRWKTLKNWEYYWLKFDKNVINFRKNIMENDLITETLSKEKLDIVNKYFFENLTTFFNFDKYTTWSNWSWSDYNKIRSPYIIFWWKYNQFLFVNFFKELKIKEILKTDLRKSWFFEEIGLEKYFELFPKIWEKFFDFNKILFTSLNSEEENSETEKIDLSNKKDYLIDLILDKNYMIWENEEKIKEKRISILRRIFKTRLRRTKPSDHLFWKLPEDMCEWAHIFPVSEIKKLDLEKWKMIADENNWLNLPTQIHKLYDSNKIYFSENWEIIFLNEEYKNYLKIMFSEDKNYKILENILNEKRKNYIKMYNQKFITKK